MSGAQGWVIHQYDSVPSTMDCASTLARYGAPDRSAVVSAEQTAGKGRGGRLWHAPPLTSLFCTLVLRPHLAPEKLSTLPLVAGVAVAEAIERIAGGSVWLKWPNDVWLGTDPDRRKVAGILTTSTLRAGIVDCALVGIGINVSSPADALPPGATSILAATGTHSTPDEVFAHVLTRFDLVYEAFLASEGRPALDSWLARAALLGELVTIEDAGRTTSGILSGIAQDGALLLQQPDGSVRRILAGDLARGPLSQPR